MIKQTVNHGIEQALNKIAIAEIVNTTDERKMIMALVRWQRPETARWDPFRQLSTLRNEIDRLFEEPFSFLGETQPFMSGWSPALDVFEDKDNLVVKAELPGMRKDEIEISLHDNVLSLSGERKE